VSLWWVCCSTLPPFIPSLNRASATALPRDPGHGGPGRGAAARVTPLRFPCGRSPDECGRVAFPHRRCGEPPPSRAEQPGLASSVSPWSRSAPGARWQTVMPPAARRPHHFAVARANAVQFPPEAVASRDRPLCWRLRRSPPARPPSIVQRCSCVSPLSAPRPQLVLPNSARGSRLPEAPVSPNRGSGSPAYGCPVARLIAHIASTGTTVATQGQLTLVLGASYPLANNEPLDPCR